MKELLPGFAADIQDIRERIKGVYMRQRPEIHDKRDHRGTETGETHGAVLLCGHSRTCADTNCTPRVRKSLSAASASAGTQPGASMRTNRVSVAEVMPAGTVNNIGSS